MAKTVIKVKSLSWSEERRRFETQKGSISWRNFSPCRTSLNSRIKENIWATPPRASQSSRRYESGRSYIDLKLLQGMIRIRFITRPSFGTVYWLCHATASEAPFCANLLAGNAIMFRSLNAWKERGWENSRKGSSRLQVSCAVNIYKWNFSDFCDMSRTMTYLLNNPHTHS